MKHLCILFILLSVTLNSQELTFSKGSSVKTRELNAELKSILDKQDITALNQYYKVNSKKINDPVITVKFIHENGLEGSAQKPAVHYVLDSYLTGTFGNPDILNWYLKNDTDVNADFQGKNILYRLLDNVAVKTSDRTTKEEECIKMILNSGKFKINQNYKALLSPFPYLIRTHFKFLNNKYDTGYLDSKLLIFLLEKGAVLETYDEQGNNLMALALTKNDNDFIQYLLSKNINLTKINQSGKDPLYFAIKNYNMEMVKQIISVLNNKVTPSYLHLIDVTELDIYKSEQVKSILLEACYPNIKDVSDIIIFSKIFYKDKNKVLNPIPIDLVPEAIPGFVSIFKSDHLSASESELIENLKVKYINTSKSYTEAIDRLKLFPLFQITNYDVSDEKMADGSKMALLKNETDKIPGKFAQLKNTLNAEYLTIQDRTNRIKENMLYVQRFYKNIKIIDNILLIQEGDGATFFEMASINRNNKFRKYKVVLVSVFQNTSTDETYAIELGVRFGYKEETTTLYFFGNTSEETVLGKSWLEIKPGETKPVVTVYDFKESYSNLGIISGARTINTEKPYKVDFYRPFYGTFSNEYTAYQRNIQNQLLANGKLETKKGYNDLIESQCNNCIVDIKKSKGPKWEVQGWIWKELIEKNGVIVMKNGQEYEFKKFIKNGKAYYQFVKDSFITETLSNEYNDFEQMLNDLMKRCKEKNCI